MKPIIYLYFHSKIMERKGKVLKERDFLTYLAQWRIPKDLRYPIMKEMVSMGLIKVDKRLVYLQDYYFDEGIRVKLGFFDSDTKKGGSYVSYDELQLSRS